MSDRVFLVLSLVGVGVGGFLVMAAAVAGVASSLQAVRLVGGDAVAVMAAAGYMLSIALALVYSVASLLGAVREALVEPSVESVVVGAMSYLVGVGVAMLVALASAAVAHAAGAQPPTALLDAAADAAPTATLLYVAGSALRPLVRRLRRSLRGGARRGTP